MNQVNESVMLKIKHLLVMAEHPNSNENEAAIAMEKAQALLFQYNLSRADVKSDNGETVTPSIGKIDGTETKGYIWRRHLLSVLAKANLCYVVITPAKKQWHLFGTYNNVQSVLEMYHWLVPELESIALRQYRKYKEECGYESGITWNKGFFFGATKSIQTRLNKPLDDFRQGTGKELVLYNDKALSEALKKVYPMGLGHTSQRIRGSDGIGAGREAGNNIHLREQRKLSGVMALGYK